MPLPGNTVLTADTKAGARSITVGDASKFHVNIELGVGMDDPKYFEVVRIKIHQWKDHHVRCAVEVRA